MTGPAVQAGSPIGGFIEGVSGGFGTITEFKRRRRLEQQVAEQLRVQTARQGREDTLAAEDRERAAEDRLRAQQLEDLELFQETGIVRAAQEVPESVSNLREAVGDNLTRQDETQAVDPTDAMLARLGFRQAVDRPQRSFTVDVGGVETVVGSEEEALRLQGAFREPEASTARFGVTGTGGRTLTGGTREQADQFASEFPHTPSNLSVSAAFQILKDRYAEFEDDGSGKLVFTGYKKSFAEMLEEARAIARGESMTPRAPEAPEIEDEPGFFKKLGQTIIPGGERGFLPPRAEEEAAPKFSREETQRRAQELEANGVPRDEIRRIMQSEGYRVQ